MRKFLSIFFGIAALAFVGCEQIENSAPETNVTEGTTAGQMTLSAGIEVDTKVDYTDGAVMLKWKESGEKITVFFLDNSYSVVGKETFVQAGLDETGKIATFTGNVPSNATKLLSVYPAIGADEDENLFVYGSNRQTGNYDETKTILRTDEITDITILDGEASATLAFTHWTYIIDATLDFGTSVTGTVSDIVFNNDNIVNTKEYKINPEIADKPGTPWNGDTSKGKGNITITETFTLTDGKAKVAIYGRCELHQPVRIHMQG